jgi:dUTP pyrophosphatase
LFIESAPGLVPEATEVSVTENESTEALQPLPVLSLAGSQFLPMRHYDDDAGLDLFVTEQRTVMPGEFVDVPAGVRIELPPGFWALILGRSSTMRKRGLVVLPAVIDTGYRGDWFAGVTNVGQHPVTVAVGERLAQFVLLPNLTSRYLPVAADALSPHPRGEQGFGSTGGHARPPDTLVRVNGDHDG